VDQVNWQEGIRNAVDENKQSDVNELMSKMNGRRKNSRSSTQLLAIVIYLLYYIFTFPIASYLSELESRLERLAV
jgi:ABC-type amino acid transport system permease subunit